MTPVYRAAIGAREALRAYRLALVAFDVSDGQRLSALLGAANVRRGETVEALADLARALTTEGRPLEAASVDALAARLDLSADKPADVEVMEAACEVLAEGEEVPTRAGERPVIGTYETTPGVHVEVLAPAPGTYAAKVRDEIAAERLAASLRGEVRDG